MTSEAQKSGMKRDVIIYFCLLVLAGIQFGIAYSGSSAPRMFVSMLAVAIVEASLALLFFMHLSENRGLKWFVLISSVFALLAMQYSWTDAFRLAGGAPWAK
jgi:caa(3)-type oxidase subunit IV